VIGVEESNHLCGERIEIAQVGQALLDDVVVDVPVPMHQHITKPHFGAHALGQVCLEHTVTTKDQHDVAVVSGRTPALGRADMLRYIDARLHGRDERVLHTTQPHLVGSPLILGVRLASQHAHVVRQRPQQAEDSNLIDHGGYSPRTRCELA
jgi:hypothetical protein